MGGLGTPVFSNSGFALEVATKSGDFGFGPLDMVGQCRRDTW